MGTPLKLVMLTIKNAKKPDHIFELIFSEAESLRLEAFLQEDSGKCTFQHLKPNGDDNGRITISIDEVRVSNALEYTPTQDELHPGFI